ncbi:hypothetical protein B0H13DRAFT_1602376, partial [Mycena leptocephala]
KRRRTEINTERTKTEVEVTYKRFLTETRIWKSMQHTDFTREVRVFMWKMMHDAFMVGDKWEHEHNRDDGKAKGQCKLCNVTESMEHILCDCNAPERSEIWALAEKLWSTKKQKWPKPAFGNILGCALAKFKDTQGKHGPYNARLYRIIVSESAYLIWKFRNERDIQNVSAPPIEIHNRWEQAINNRLEFDCRSTNPKYGKKASPRSKIIRTWEGTLKDEMYLPPDWTNKSGF